MEGRKKPGPHPEKPLIHDLKVRVDDETLSKKDVSKEADIIGND